MRSLTPLRRAPGARPSARLPMRLALLLLAATATLAACGTDDAPSGVSLNSGVGRVRLANATPDTARARTVNAWFDDAPSVPLTANLAYGVATDYRAVTTGAHELNVRRTSDTTLVVLDAPLDVALNTDYTVLATGLLPDLLPVVLTDDNAAPAAGEGKLRIVNAAPSAGAVDVYVTAPDVADISALAPTVSGLGFRSASAYLALAAGAQRVRVTGAGTQTVLLDTAAPAVALALAAGQIRTVLVLDKPGGGQPLQASVLVDRNP